VNSLPVDDPTPSPITSTSNWKNLFDNTVLTGNQNPIDVFDLDCPEGMGLADWDTDMSGSSRFAWIVANTNPGVDISAVDHNAVESIYFKKEPNTFTKSFFQGEGAYGFNSQSINYLSIAKKCIINKNRKLIYGFYVCDKLIIENGRTSPLNIVGTFIVNSIHGGTVFKNTTLNAWDANLTPKPILNHPIIWRTVWDPISADLFMNHYNKIYVDDSGNTQNNCTILQNMTSINMLQQDKKTELEDCSAVKVTEDGINNFRWTTVDPDIGLATPTSVMTSQKVTRVHRWIIREDSRVDLVK
jgi:hypothetical protein